MDKTKEILGKINKELLHLKEVSKKGPLNKSDAVSYSLLLATKVFYEEERREKRKRSKRIS